MVVPKNKDGHLVQELPMAQRCYRCPVSTLSHSLLLHCTASGCNSPPAHTQAPGKRQQSLGGAHKGLNPWDCPGALGSPQTRGRERCQPWVGARGQSERRGIVGRFLENLISSKSWSNPLGFRWWASFLLKDGETEAQAGKVSTQGHRQLASISARAWPQKTRRNWGESHSWAARTQPLGRNVFFSNSHQRTCLFILKREEGRERERERNTDRERETSRSCTGPGTEPKT